MPPSRHLSDLLAALDPRLEEPVYVFALLHGNGDAAVRRDAIASAVTTVVEEEGTTLILPATDAVRLGLRHEFRCRRLTLRVHSELAAVGLSAAVAAALADAAIPANVVAGFHHDHVLVPAAEAERAREVLVALAATAAAG